MSYLKYSDPDQFRLYEYSDMIHFLNNSCIGDKFAMNEEEIIYAIDSLPTYPRKYEIAKMHNRCIELLTANQRFFIAYNNQDGSIQPELFLTNEEDLQNKYSYVHSICTNPVPKITPFIE